MWALLGGNNLSSTSYCPSQLASTILTNQAVEWQVNLITQVERDWHYTMNKSMFDQREHSILKEPFQSNEQLCCSCMHACTCMAEKTHRLPYTQGIKIYFNNTNIWLHTCIFSFNGHKFILDSHLFIRYMFWWLYAREGYIWSYNCHITRIHVYELTIYFKNTHNTCHCSLSTCSVLFWADSHSQFVKYCCFIETAGISEIQVSRVI